PVEFLKPLAEIEGVELYSLQFAAHETPGFPIVDLTKDVRDFSDTAGLVANLDLVITVDTAVAHLAGGMGKPVWVMLAKHADWRWMLEREDSPWYPTMRLFRQREAGKWDEVVERMMKSFPRERP